MEIVARLDSRVALSDPQLQIVVRQDSRVALNNPQGFVFFLPTLGDTQSDWPPPYLPPTYLLPLTGRFLGW